MDGTMAEHIAAIRWQRVDLAYKTTGNEGGDWVPAMQGWLSALRALRATMRLTVAFGSSGARLVVAAVHAPMGQSVLQNVQASRSFWNRQPGDSHRDLKSLGNPFEIPPGCTYTTGRRMAGRDVSDTSRMNKKEHARVHMF